MKQKFNLFLLKIVTQMIISHRNPTIILYSYLWYLYPPLVPPRNLLPHSQITVLVGAWPASLKWSLISLKKKKTHIIQPLYQRYESAFILLRIWMKPQILIKAAIKYLRSWILNINIFFALFTSIRYFQASGRGC